MVLQFNTIKEIVRLQPKTHDDLIRIKGIGPAKVRKYGDDLLKIVRGDGIVGNEMQSGTDLFSEADVVNEAVLTSKNPPSADVAFDPETGEVIEDVKDDTVSVTEFVTMLDTMLRTHFKSVRVQGEVVGFKRNASGHAYFEIKDKTSVLRCMLFSSRYDLSGVELEDGMEVVITGYPNYHKQYGFGFVGTMVELYGEGALKKAYDALKKKLDHEGLLVPEKKRELPKLPERIGLITSKTGAAIGDFTMNVGQYGYKIIFHQSRVEGAGAIEDLSEALTAMAKKSIDVLVIVRGGGSLESLQAFNNENIVRMVADFPVPVIAGVGHEQDETLTTLVADKGVSTPTAAARAVRESWDQCEEYLSSREQYLLRHFDKIFSHFHDVFVRFGATIGRIDDGIRSQEMHLDNYQSHIVNAQERGMLNAKKQISRVRLAKYVQASIAQCDERLTFFNKSLEQHSPQRQLSLGYSIARDGDGKIVRKVSDVKKDERLDVQVSDGEIRTVVRD